MYGLYRLHVQSACSVPRLGQVRRITIPPRPVKLKQLHLDLVADPRNTSQVDLTRTHAWGRQNDAVLGPNHVTRYQTVRYTQPLFTGKINCEPRYHKSYVKRWFVFKNLTSGNY